MIPQTWRTGALVAAAAALIPAGYAAGHAAASTGQKPPECVKWRVVENSGAGPVLHLQLCGTGSAGESPARDDSAYQTMVVDGGPITPAGCTRAAPCVVLWPRSPQGTKPGS